MKNMTDEEVQAAIDDPTTTDNERAALRIAQQVRKIPGGVHLQQGRHNDEICPDCGFLKPCLCDVNGR